MAAIPNACPVFILNQRDTNFDKEIFPMSVKPIATGKVKRAKYMANVVAKDSDISPRP